MILSVFLCKKRKWTLLLTVISAANLMAGCDKGPNEAAKEQEGERSRRAIDQEQANRAEKTANGKREAENKAKEQAEEVKQKERKFAQSADGAIKQLRAMKLRWETGITLIEFRQKLGQMSDAIAAVDSPPTERAKQIAKDLRIALEQYNKAQEPAEREVTYREWIRQHGTPDPRKSKDDNIVPQIGVDGYQKAHTERLEATERADAAAARAETAVAELNR